MNVPDERLGTNLSNVSRNDRLDLAFDIVFAMALKFRYDPETIANMPLDWFFELAVRLFDMFKAQDAASKGEEHISYRERTRSAVSEKERQLGDFVSRVKAERQRAHGSEATQKTCSEN